MFGFAIVAIAFSGCVSGYKIGQMVPEVLGGAPNTIPPPRGTPEYEAWLAKPAPNAQK